MWPGTFRIFHKLIADVIEELIRKDLIEVG